MSLHTTIMNKATLLLLVSFIGCSINSMFGNAASTMSPLRTPRIPNPRITNSETDFSTAGSKLKNGAIHIPNIDLLVDHAEFALNSYLPSAEILKTLRRTKTNVRIIQRTLDHVGASYNIIQYSEKSSDNVRWVISIPGSRNNKNMQQNMDNKLVLDDVLNIKVHRGYRGVYRAILADFIQEEARIRGLFKSSPDSDATVTVMPKEKISLSVTGHSLGGAVSCMVAAALQLRGYTIDHVTVFGTPKFTDKKGALQLVENLPIERVEHVMDPVSISPMGMPLPFPFVDNYADLESEALLVLEPAKKSIARMNMKRNEELNSNDNDNDIGGLNLNIIQTVQSVLQNPLSSLSEFNWRGERILEQLEKHKVYAGREAIRRTGMFLRMGDVFSIHWQWHSMRAYHALLKEYQEGRN